MPNYTFRCVRSRALFARAHQLLFFAPETNETKRLFIEGEYLPTLLLLRSFRRKKRFTAGLIIRARTSALLRRTHDGPEPPTKRRLKLNYKAYILRFLYTYTFINIVYLNGVFCVRSRVHSFCRVNDKTFVGKFAHAIIYMRYGIPPLPYINPFICLKFTKTRARRKGINFERRPLVSLYTFHRTNQSIRYVYLFDQIGWYTYLRIRY